jgi:hypothetical protein
MRHACLAALALLAAACSDSAAPPGRDETPSLKDPSAAQPDRPEGRSRYTRLDECQLTRSAPEEAGFFEHECSGEGGYRLRHVEADLRENLIVLAPGGGEHSLELPALAAGAFSGTGDTAEWRGVPGAAGFAPSALIVRQSVVEDPDPKVPEISYLVVARLAPIPCVIARVPPGPDQNARARAVADESGACLATPARAG